MVTVLSIKIARRCAIAPTPLPRLDRDLGPAGSDLRRERRAALDAHLFVEQDETGVLVRQG
jgi:hypothetical protein